MLSEPAFDRYQPYLSHMHKRQYRQKQSSAHLMRHGCSFAAASLLMIVELCGSDELHNYCHSAIGNNNIYSSDKCKGTRFQTSIVRSSQFLRSLCISIYRSDPIGMQ